MLLLQMTATTCNTCSFTYFWTLQEQQDIQLQIVQW